MKKIQQQKSGYEMWRRIPPNRLNENNIHAYNKLPSIIKQHGNTINLLFEAEQVCWRNWKPPIDL